MRVRSIPRIPNSVSAASSAPGAFSIRNTTDVRSAPVRAGGGPGGPIRTKRVRALVSSTTPSASVASSQCAAASGDVTAASTSPVGHLSRGVGVGVRGPQFGAGQMGGEPLPHLRRGHREGRQRAHVGGAAAGLTTMLNATSSVVSANTCSGEPMARLSNVGASDPSIEFSIGTQA